MDDIILVALFYAFGMLMLLAAPRHWWEALFRWYHQGSVWLFRQCRRPVAWLLPQNRD